MQWEAKPLGLALPREVPTYSRTVPDHYHATSHQDVFPWPSYNPGIISMEVPKTQSIGLNQPQIPATLPCHSGRTR